MKLHRFNLAAIIGLILLAAATLSIATFSVASALADPKLTVDETEMSTRSSIHNYVTGRISYSDGQTVALYDAGGNRVAEYRFEGAGVNEPFFIEMPELREGTTKFYVRHTDTEGVKSDKPIPVTIRYTPSKTVEEEQEDGTNAKLNAIIASLCWPEGTSKSKYKFSSGSPKDAYVDAAQTYLGKEVGEVRKGKRVAFSDCGYFVSTVIRMTGVDPKFRALKFRYADKHPDWFVVYEGHRVDQSILVAGDVIQYKKKGGGNHVLMYIGNGYLAHASRHDQFPRILKMRPPGKEMFNGSNVATVQVIRNKKLAAGN